MTLQTPKMVAAGVAALRKMDPDATDEEKVSSVFEAMMTVPVVGSMETLFALEPEPDKVNTAIEKFNEFAARCPKWTRAKNITPNRRKIIAARLKDVGMAGWIRAVEMAAYSAFLGGNVSRAGSHANWRMTIEWFAKAENFAKITEGGYPPGRNDIVMNNSQSSAMDGIADFMNGVGRGH